MERINTPFTGEHFIATLRKWRELGAPYWYGTHGNNCTRALLERKKAQYSAHYTDSRMPKYHQDIAENAICADCIGALKGYAWTHGGEGLLESYGKPGTVKQSYGSHGVPDRSANGMFEYAKEQGMEWGSIDTIPEIIGLCVRYDGHVGYYAGNGEVEEWRGFAFGSQRTRLKDRKWTHWYKHPALNYSDDSVTEPIIYTLGSRLLLLRKPETSGSDVEMLVSLLTQLGYNIPEDKRDGTYNPAVSAAVIRFQAASQLLGDGDYGPDTHKALMAAVSDADAGQAPAEPEEPAAPETPEEPAQPEEPVQPEEPAVRMVEIISKGGAVNIRSGNGTQYAKVTTVKPGLRFVYVATAVNSWNAIEINGQIGWVSGDYSKIEDGGSENEKSARAIPDISRWQEDIDFDKLAPEVEFVIARGAYGTGKDARIDVYAAEMQRLSVPYGLYQYSIAATPEEARAEAQAFHAAFAAQPPRFWVLDAEKPYITAEIIRAWVDEMRVLGAKKLGCYVAHNLYKGYGFDDLRGLFDFVWIPRYGKNDGTVEGSTQPDYPCDLWQYTSAGKLPGIGTSVDLNKLMGDKGAEWFREE